jgi:Fe-S cluster assembly ATP-binding protein
MLTLEDVHVSVEGKEIIHGVSLTLEQGKVHALMGPNGSGKSSLAHALMGHPKYIITKGKIILDGEDITSLPTYERARKGLFLSFQYPVEIEGVTLSHFLRTSLQAIKGKKIPVIEFHQMLKEKMKALGMDAALSKRSLNQGFSGGEKKRAEILQMSVLEPSYAILDETDSGLDVDALKIVAESIAKMDRSSLGVLLITHYQRMLEYITPDEVSVLIGGKIVATGNKELAEQIEQDGYDRFQVVS